MNPNVALTVIRAALDVVNNSDDEEEVNDAFATLAEHVEALDGWLSRGGFLPDDWRPEELRSADRTYDLVNPEED